MSLPQIQWMRVLRWSALIWTQPEFLSNLRRLIGLKYHPDPQPTLYKEEINFSWIKALNFKGYL